MRPGLWAAMIIAAATMLTNLGTARLWDRDEPRNAQCAREMLESGNWIIPTFDGELRTHKPVLLYWGQIAAYQLLGVNEWGARIPSAMAAIGTVLLVYWMGSRLASPQVATWSAISMGTMLLFVMAGRAATPDALLVSTFALAVALFVRFAFVSETSNHQDGTQFLKNLRVVWPSWRQWSSVYAACGLAVLAKGPVGLVLPIAVIGLTLLWVMPLESHWSRWWHLPLRVIAYGWRMRPLTALVMTACIAGPWYVAVTWATDGVWTREFLFTHNVSRAVSTMEGHSGPPILFYLGALLVGTFPWSCFAIPVGLSVKAQHRVDQSWHPLLALTLAWIAVFIGVFSIASTKLPSYITPCYPAVALLVGWYVARAIAGQIYHPRWMFAGLCTAMLIGFTLFGVIGGPLAEQIPEIRPIAIAGMVLGVAGVLAVALARRTRLDLAMRSFVIGAVGVILILHGFGPAAADAGRDDLTALQKAFDEYPETHWWAERSVEPSWVFYSNRRVHLGLPPQNTKHASLNEAVLVSADEHHSNHAERQGRIDYVLEPVAGSIPVFLNDGYLKIVEPLAETRVASKSTLTK